MSRLFLDTNVVLDLLAKREGFYEPTAQLFSLADKGKVTLFVSSLSFATVFYILRKNVGMEKAKELLHIFKVLVTVLSVDDKVIELSLNSDINDFEDAIQNYCAVENDISAIITRDLKDFKKSQLAVISPADFIRSFA